MKVGVLGSTGFVGRNLTEALNKANINFVGASRRSGVNARHDDDVYDWLKQNEVTHLVNLAAECGGIGLNQRSPADLWVSTQRISASVLEACMRHNIEKLIQLGTVCSYSADQPVPFQEDCIMYHGPPEATNRAYGIAKLSGLYGAQAYHKQFGLRVCNLIAVNMYGKYDHFDLLDSHVIPAIIKKINDAMKNDAEVVLWGSGSPTREFLHASDFANAVILALKNEHSRANDGTFINVGTGKEISIKDLANIIADLMDYKGQIVWDKKKPDGQMRRCLDISKAKFILDYNPEIALRHGLRETIDWYLHHN